MESAGSIPRKIRSLDQSKMRFFKVASGYFLLQIILAVFEIHSTVRLNLSMWKCVALFLVFTWYGISFFFLLNPQYLHKKQKKLRLPKYPKYLKDTLKGQKYRIGTSPPYIVSHRGGSLDAPENTMQSFMFCVENGIDVIESDVRITRDGQIIVCHDDTFDRICKQDGSFKPGQKVMDTDFSCLPKFKDEMPICFSDGSIRYKRKPTDQESFSKLEDIFKAVPYNQLIQIEIKDQHNEYALRKTVRLVQKYNRQRTTILGSLKPKHMDLIRQMDRTIPTFCNFKDVLWIQIYFFLGLLPFCPVPFESLSSSWLTREYVGMKQRQRNEQQTWSGWMHKTVFLHFLYPLFQYQMSLIFVHMNKRGIFTNLWVINDADELDDVYRKTNAAGIMTDRGRYTRDLYLCYAHGISQQQIIKKMPKTGVISKKSTSRNEPILEEIAEKSEQEEVGDNIDDGTQGANRVQDGDQITEAAPGFTRSESLQNQEVLADTYVDQVFQKAVNTIPKQKQNSADISHSNTENASKIQLLELKNEQNTG